MKSQGPAGLPWLAGARGRGMGFALGATINLDRLTAETQAYVGAVC